MPRLVPVEGDPFSETPPAVAAEPKLVPVEGDPFKETAAPAASSSTEAPTEPKLTPVAGNPFGPDAPNEEESGIASIAMQAAKRGLLEGAGQVGETMKAIKRGSLEGGTSHAPEPDDELSKLLAEPVTEGFNNSKWWAAHLSHGLASGAPTLGGAVAGGLAGAATPIPGGAVGGAAVGGAVGAVAQTLVPAYQKARDEGLDEDASFERAWQEAVVQGGAAGVMALLPGVEVAKGPIKNAIIHMFGTIPATGAAAGVAARKIEGLDVSPDQIATDMSVGAAMGVPFVGLHAATVGRGRRAPSAEAALPASDADIAQTFNESVARPGGARPEGPLPPSVEQLASLDPTANNEKPWYYSQVRKTAEEKLPRAGSAEQMLATLENTPGVKGDELDALGIRDWLKAQGSGRVTKEDLIREIESNAVQVETVTKGGSPSKIVFDPPESAEDGTNIYWARDNTSGERIHYRIEESVGQDGSAQYSVHMGNNIVGNYPDMETAQGQLIRRVEAVRGLPTSTGRTDRQTVYGDWKLPGGENYREVLLKLPERKGPNDPAALARFDALDLKQAHGELTPEERAEFNALNSRLGQIESGGDNFRGSHWDEANVLAHVRMTDRADAMGNRSLFVEEVQSDWHQQGRSDGYKGDPKDIPAIKSLVNHDRGRWDVEFADGERFDISANSSTIARMVARDEWMSSRRPVPQAPFKTSWSELAVKRILKMAADEGYDRVAFTTGDAQNVVYRGQLSKEQISGQREFYDKILPRVVEKWAKKLGGKTGDVTIKYADPYRDITGSRLGNPLVVSGTLKAHYVEITPLMKERLQGGLPLFSLAADAEKLGKNVTLSLGRRVPGAIDHRPAARQAALAVLHISKRMGIDKPINIRLDTEHPNALGTLAWYRDLKTQQISHYDLMVSVGKHANPEEIYATVAHEFGHLIKNEKFDSAPTTTKLSIQLAFDTWRLSTRNVDSLKELITQRDNYVSNLRNLRAVGDRKLSEMAPEMRRYWLSFDEWFAEQTARWMTTSEKPLNIVDKFFSSLARKIREGYEYFALRFGKDKAQPNPYMGKWLDSLILDGKLSGYDVMTAMEERSRQMAKGAWRSLGIEDFPAEGATPASSLSRELAMKIAPDGEPSNWWKASAGAVDRFNKAYNVMLGMTQVADRNPHIQPLQRYREVWQQISLERQRIMDEATTTLRGWKEMNNTARDRVAGLIDDYMNLRFLREDEKVAGVSRRPSQEEFAKLVKDNKVGKQGLDVFQRVVADFDRMLTRYGEILVESAARITDPAKQAEALQSIGENIAQLRKAPYFPAMRFGDYTLLVRDAAGQVKHFETFESKATRRGALREIKSQMDAGDTYHLGALPKDARPMMGIPTRLLDMMGEKLDLSKGQREALEYMRHELAPAQSFKHRFQRKNRVEGYSMDFMRAYANYFFHGSNYFTKLRHTDSLQEHIAAVRDSAKTMIDGTKRDQIANFLSDHFSYMMDPKADFAFLRQFAFLWFLGWSPAAAALNLTQMMVGSYPFLASKFGDFGTIGAMGRAGAKMSTYYRRGTLENVTERELRAISEGIKEGVITEAMAPELAAISEGRNLGKKFGSDTVASGWQSFMESSSKLFEMSEQMNRRITFRAAFALASDNPAAKYVTEMVKKHELQYERLREAGWTQRDAAAFVVAKDATESTQFVYQQYAQPKYSRGHLKTVFVFKTFMQNSLFMLWNYPTAAARSLLIMGALGGMMGVPGMEDMRGLLKALAWKLFGKDFDLEDEARKFAIDVMGEKIPPDLLLHGASRYGMGMPMVMEAAGVPFPVLDRSSSVGMGRILPVDVGALFGPGASKDSNRAIASETQRASGAVFGTGFNLYKALTDGGLEWSDIKRWERILPRTAQGLSKSYRAFSEGRERDRAGNTVIQYDVNDPQQMMEAIALGLGYTPLRQSAQWDRKFAEMEAVQFWDIRREALMKQLWTARGDKEQYASVLGAIRKFNTEVKDTPARMKAITAETIERSFQSRAHSSASVEAGIPRREADIPIVREVQRLYPEAKVDVRRVK